MAAPEILVGTVIYKCPSRVLAFVVGRAPTAGELLGIYTTWEDSRLLGALVARQPRNRPPSHVEILAIALDADAAVAYGFGGR